MEGAADAAVNTWIGLIGLGSLNPRLHSRIMGPFDRRTTIIMTETSFAVRAQQTIEDIVERMEADDTLSDLDLDLIDGVLTVEFEDGSQLILNRQEAAGQLWLASPEGPAHFDFDSGRGDWLNDRTGAPLLETLERVISEKLGEPVRL